MKADNLLDNYFTKNWGLFAVEGGDCGGIFVEIGCILMAHVSYPASTIEFNLKVS